MTRDSALKTILTITKTVCKKQNMIKNKRYNTIPSKALLFYCTDPSDQTQWKPGGSRGECPQSVITAPILHSLFLTEDIRETA